LRLKDNQLMVGYVQALESKSRLVMEKNATVEGKKERVKEDVRTSKGKEPERRRPLEGVMTHEGDCATPRRYWSHQFDAKAVQSSAWLDYRAKAATMGATVQGRGDVWEEESGELRQPQPEKLGLASKISSLFGI